LDENLLKIATVRFWAETTLNNLFVGKTTDSFLHFLESCDVQFHSFLYRHVLRIDVDAEILSVVVGPERVQQGLGLMWIDDTDVVVLIVVAVRKIIQLPGISP